MGLVKDLINARADIHLTTKAGATALNIAISSATASFKESDEIAGLLISARANIEHRTSSDQDTPLMISAFFNKPLTVKRLLDARADVNAKSSKGETALDLAKKFKKIRKMLKKAGAKKGHGEDL